jgi:hypothetical protein
MTGVEWAFLHDMMVPLGFAQRWVDLIMKCVSTVTYSIKVNGGLIENFTQEAFDRGIRYRLICSYFVQRDFQLS